MQILNMTISFEKFDRAYSQFCFKEGLKHQQDSETIRKYMILKCNARVLVKQVDVVTGVRWIDESVSETNGGYSWDTISLCLHRITRPPIRITPLPPHIFTHWVSGPSSSRKRLRFK